MPVPTSLQNLYGYFQEHGLPKTLAFMSIKARAMVAKHDLGWKLLFESNPFVATGDSSDYTEKAKNTWNALQQVSGLQTREYCFEPSSFQGYVTKAQYEAYGPYYMDNGTGNSKHRIEKLLQHFLSLQFLDIQPTDVYIDVASNTSPMKQIVRQLYGIKTYRMDLKYPPGINGDQIGCDAGDTGLSVGFVSKMSLHCSFEHFAYGSDIRFVREASRILRPGGKVCIIPLYILDRYSIRQDPTLETDLGLKDKEGATRVFVRDYRVDYGRFYDVRNFEQRILKNCGDLIPTVYHVTNLAVLHPEHCYSHFALILEKPA